jgi:hypothetical protein
MQAEPQPSAAARDGHHGPPELSGDQARRSTLGRKLAQRGIILGGPGFACIGAGRINHMR